MVGCGRILTSEFIVLVPHDKDWGVSFWSDRPAWKKVLGPGILYTHTADASAADDYPCGKRLDYVTPLCLDCAKKEGLMW